MIMQPQDLGTSNWTDIQFSSIFFKRSFLTLRSNLILNQRKISNKTSGQSAYFWYFT